MEHFEALVPPTEIAELNERLIAEVRRFADSMDELANLIEAQNIVEIREFGDRWDSDPHSPLNQLIEILNQMNEAGY